MATITLNAIPKDATEEAGYRFQVHADAISFMGTIKNLRTDVPDADNIPCHDVVKEDADHIAYVADYLVKNWPYAADKIITSEDKSKWTEDETRVSLEIEEYMFNYFQNITGPKKFSRLYPLFEAAQALEFTQLEELIAKYCAVRAVIGKEVEEIRENLEIECDYTPEELEALSKNNDWIYPDDV